MPSASLIARLVVALAAATAPVLAGDITGTVRYAGAPPARKPIEITKDQAICGRVEHVEESLVVGAGGGVRDVVVHLVDPPGAPPMPVLTPNVTVDQNGCRFVPRIQIIPAGAPFDLVNSDDLLHNIHTWSKANPSFNRAQPKFKKVLTQSFAKPEIMRISCDVHPWMNGWLVIAGHAYYAKTSPDGTFRISGVPAGDYTIEFWQELLGVETRPVKVPATGSTSVDLLYPARQAP